MAGQGNGKKTTRIEDLDEEMPFAARLWKVQRVAWVVGVMVLVAALAGSFGRGPVAQGKDASEDGSVEVAYDRIAHNHSPTQLDLSLDGKLLDAEGRVRVRLSSDMLRKLRIEQVGPEPEEATSTPEGVVFTLRGNARAGERFPVMIFAEAQRMGWIDCRVDVVAEDGRTVVHRGVEFGVRVLP